MPVLPCRYCGGLIYVPAKYARAKTAAHPDCIDFDRYWDECEKHDPIQPRMRPNTYFLTGLALSILIAATAIAYGTRRPSSDLPPTPVSVSHHGHADGSHTGI